jgi:nitrogen fixation protein FixH
MKFAIFLFGLAAFAADIQIDYEVPKDAKANFETPLLVKLKDSKRQPVSGANVEVILTMVDMDHGEFKHEAKLLKPGVYRAMVKFVMVGAWQIEVRAKTASETVTKKFRHEQSQ